MNSRREKYYLKRSVDMCQYHLCSARYSLETGRQCKVLGGKGCFYDNTLTDKFDHCCCVDKVFIYVR